MEPKMTTSRRLQPTTFQELMEIPHSSMEAFYKRLQSEFRHLKNGLPREILSFSIVNENDLQHYEAKILGPDGTPYEKGVFALSIYLPRTPHVNNKSFPFVPPEMKFKTTVFHPNISSKGDICLDILNCQWNPSQSFVTTLLSICSLLSDPNINDFLVPEAAFLYKVNRQEYDRKAREWTRKYATTGDVAIEAEQDSNRLNKPTDTVTTMNILASSDETVQQQAIDIQTCEKRRLARFNVVESLQPKTFDHGESKEYVPIIAQCLSSTVDREEKYRNQMNDFHDGAENLDINNELQSLITALEREGIKLEKQEQSEILINELYTLIDATPDQIGHGCLHLYSMETFLYPQLNQFLREADHTKVEIYGSFVRLLCFYFNHPSSIEVHGIEVYRGMNLSSSVIDTYEEAAKSGTSYRWTGFSSTSKSRQFVKDFNTNTLFIMQLKKIYSREKKAIDISGYSQFPEEEEVLLKAGVEFTVEKVNYDNEKEKYYIYLNVYV